MAKERVLTENQKAFLDALFGEAEGDPVLAKKLAGYADSVKVSEITRSLKQELSDLSHDKLSIYATKAAIQLINLMDNPNEAGAVTKIKVIQQILDRVGVATKSDSVDLKVPAGGLFIMPAKEVKSDKEIDTDENSEG